MILKPVRPSSAFPGSARLSCRSIRNSACKSSRILHTLGIMVLIAALPFAAGAQGTKAKPPAPARPAVISPAALQAALDSNTPPATPDPDFLIFLLIGQSNMEGVPGPEEKDVVADPRVKVLAYTNSPTQKRVWNQWYTAVPPLHSPGAGVGIGDWFGKTLSAALPEKYTIGLVPCAISGVDIDFFRKGVVSSRRGEFKIPPENKQAGAYEMVMEKARLAQKYGRIAGILFHQGESDSGDPQWPGKVAEMVKDLRTDLGLGDIPFLAGEMYYFGVCQPHNALVKKLPDLIPAAWVISAKKLMGTDNWHFELSAQRELGKRYARKIIEVLGADLGIKSED